MSFPSPHMSGPHGGMGGYPMLPGPNMMPPSPMGMQGSQMQLARRGSMGGHGAALMPPSHMSVGHPNAMNPMEAQCMQAAHLHGGHGGGFSPGMHSGGSGMPSLQGAPQFGGMPHAAMGGSMPNPHMMGPAGPDLSALAMLRAQGQGMYQSQDPRMNMMAQGPGSMGGLPSHSGMGFNQDPFGSSGHGATGGFGGQLTFPQMDPETAYVRGSHMPTNGSLRGQSSGTGAHQTSGNGDFDMEQEVTVKTKLRGRGTFSGSMMGGMTDSQDISANMGSVGQLAPGPDMPMHSGLGYDNRPLLGHQSPYSHSGYPGAGTFPRARASTPF